VGQDYYTTPDAQKMKSYDDYITNRIGGDSEWGGTFPAYLITLRFGIRCVLFRNEERTMRAGTDSLVAMLAAKVCPVKHPELHHYLECLKVKLAVGIVGPTVFLLHHCHGKWNTVPRFQPAATRRRGKQKGGIEDDEEGTIQCQANHYLALCPLPPKLAPLKVTPNTTYTRRVSVADLMLRDPKIRSLSDVRKKRIQRVDMELFEDIPILLQQKS